MKHSLNVRQLCTGGMVAIVAITAAGATNSGSHSERMQSSLCSQALLANVLTWLNFSRLRQPPTQTKLIGQLALPLRTWRTRWKPTLRLAGTWLSTGWRFVKRCQLSVAVLGLVRMNQVVARLHKRSAVPVVYSFYFVLFVSGALSNQPMSIISSITDWGFLRQLVCVTLITGL